MNGDTFIFSFQKQHAANDININICRHRNDLTKVIVRPCLLIIATMSVAHVKLLPSHSRGFNVVRQIPANHPLK